MGNIQTILQPVDSQHPETDDLSFFSSCSEDSEVLTPSDEHQSRDTTTTTTTRGNKIMCEFCQEYQFPQFHAQHQRFCASNPNNMRILLESQSNCTGSTSCQPELEKIACEFCNEPCYVKFHSQHLRVCPKNPENIKINCRYCDRTLSSVLYHSHVDACEELHQYRRRSVEPRSGRGRGNLESLRKIKTNNEIEKIEDYDCSRVKCGQKRSKKPVSECSICLEEIETRFDMSTLTCSHGFHRKCIDKWARRQRRCPICRKDFF